MTKPYTEDELINYLKESARDNHGYPRWSDFRKDNNYPSYAAIRRHFGSWTAGCEIAGFSREYEYLTKGVILSYYDALDICFTEFKYSIPSNRKGIDKTTLLNVLATGNNVTNELGYSDGKAAGKFLKKVFPDKPAQNNSDYNWLLLKKGWLKCNICQTVKTTENFYSNSSNILGYSRSCKECEEPNKSKRTATRKSSKLSATPTWGQNGIEEFYKECPDGYHVDHIVPLKGKYVCGLHVLNNLQYLPAAENLTKSNYHESEKDWGFM